MLIVMKVTNKEKVANTFEKLLDFNVKKFCPSNGQEKKFTIGETNAFHEDCFCEAHHYHEVLFQVVFFFISSFSGKFLPIYINDVKNKNSRRCH